MNDLPFIPLDDLFTEIAYPEPLRVPPLRWISVKSAMDILGVSERMIRQYIKDGKVDYIHKTVNGRKRVYLSNRSIYNLNLKRRNKKPSDNKENTEEDMNVIGALLYIAEKVLTSQ